MKTRVKTIKGWVNNSNKVFENNLKKYEEEHLQGFKKLRLFETLKDKNATEKVIIKGWYWRNTWVGGEKQVVTTYYK